MHKQATLLHFTCNFNVEMESYMNASAHVCEGKTYLGTVRHGVPVPSAQGELPTADSQQDLLRRVVGPVGKGRVATGGSTERVTHAHLLQWMPFNEDKRHRESTFRVCARASACARVCLCVRCACTCLNVFNVCLSVVCMCTSVCACVCVVWSVRV